MPGGTATITVDFVGRNRLGNIVASIGRVLQGVAQDVVGIGVSSVMAAADYETAFTSLLKTTNTFANAQGNLTREGKVARQELRKMAKEIPQGADELAEMAAVLGQMGVQEDQITSMTRTIADLGVATDVTAERAAMDFSKIGSVMGVETGNMAEFAGDFGNALVALGNNFASTESTILSGAKRLAPAASVIGANAEMTLAFSTALAQVGVEPERGTTALQKALLSMHAAVNTAAGGVVDYSKEIGETEDKLTSLQATLVKTEAKTGMTEQQMRDLHDAFIAGGGSAEEWGRQLGDTNRKQLWETIDALDETRESLKMLEEEHGKVMTPEKLETFARVSGMTVKDFKEQWEKDAAGTFQAFVDGLANSGDDAVGILGDLGLGAERVRGTMLALAGGNDELARAMETAYDQYDHGNALNREAERRYGTFESRLKVFKNTIRDVGITIGDTMLPALKDILEKGAPAIDKLAKQLGPFFEETVVPAITNVANAVLGFIDNINFEQLGEQLQNMWDKGGEILGLLVEKFNEIKDFITAHWETIEGALIGLGVVLAGLAVGGTIVAIVAALGTLLSPIGLIAIAAAALGAAWNTNFLGIRDTLTEFWENTARPALENLYAWLQEKIPQAVEKLSSFWNETLAPALSNVGFIITDIVVPAVAASYEGIVTFLEVCWKLAEVVAAVSSKVWEFAIAILKEALEPIVIRIKNLFALLAGTVLSDVLISLSNLTKEVNNPVRAALEYLKGILEKIKDAFGDIKDAAKKFIGWLQKLIDKINSVEIPSWASGHSPPPLADWFGYIADEIARTNAEMATFKQNVAAPFAGGMPPSQLVGAAQSAMNAPAGGGAAGAGPQYHLHINTTAPTENIIADFHTLRALAGVAS